MNDEKEFDLTARNKHYTVVTGEYFGTKNPRYMLIRSELHGSDGVTLFVLGVDLVLTSIKFANIPQEEANVQLYQAASESIAAYLEKNILIEGKTYYGEYLENGTFEIGQEKPAWEDGNWGQKASF